MQKIASALQEKVASVFRGAQSKHDRKQAAYPEANILDLKPHQFYPDKERLRSEFFKSIRHELLTKSTPIGSMGSCFAREVKDYLVEKGYNYVQTAEGPNARHASAAWDRVYNTFCIRQEFERALGTFEPAEKHWVIDGVMRDPYRKAVEWAGPEAMSKELAEHKRTAALALTTVEAMVVTIGINEIWYSRDDGSVFYQVPPAAAFDPERHAFRLGTYEENLQNLERSYELLQQANPGAKLVVSVSPVPLRATFRDDADVVSASFETKCLLLAATKEFVRRSPNAYYFPGYEITWATIRDPFQEDARHVKREVVHQVMEVFDYQFMK